MSDQEEDLTNAQLLKLINQNIDEKFEKLRLDIDNRNRTVENKIETINSTVEKLTSENIELWAQVESLEQKIRKNNIVIFGLKVSERNILQDTLQKLNEKLGTTLTATDVATIYKPTKKQKDTPIILEFKTYSAKIEIFKNTRKLKGTGIFIANDKSRKERNIDKVLRAKYRQAKANNQNAKIVGSKIIIDGISYSYEECLHEKRKKEVNVIESSDSDPAGSDGDERSVNPKQKHTGAGETSKGGIDNHKPGRSTRRKPEKKNKH